MVAGSYAYIVDYYGGLHIISVRDPSRPTKEGMYTTLGGVQGVAVAGRYAYVAATDLYIRDVTDPARPIEVRFYPKQGKFVRCVAVPAS